MPDEDQPAPNAYNPAEDGWTRSRRSPFLDQITPFWMKPEGEGVVFGMQCVQSTLNRAGNLHGGALMTFCDHAMDGTLSHVISVADGPDALPVRSVTVQFNVQFIGAVRPLDFVTGRFRVLRRTRSLLFIDGLVDVEGTTVAAAHAIFKLMKPDHLAKST